MTFDKPNTHSHSADDPSEGDDSRAGDVTADGEDKPGPVIHRHTIHKPLPGRRLDKYLHGRHPRISRTTLQRYIKQGQVTINGLPTKASHEPMPGETIQIVLPPPEPTGLIPEDIPIDIVYEDDWILVVNKQAGIICHPARATQSGTLANAVAYHAKTLSKGSDPFRPGIIHRLDKNTTGVMVIAKTDEAHWRISAQFERRTTRKEYFAICEGEIQLDGDLINKPLAPHPETTQRMVLPAQSPPRQAMFKEAITEYRVDKRYVGFTTVNLFPKTGRTHQLRVHMSSIGHPMMGDTMYGGPLVSERDLAGTGGSEPLISFQALHARRLAFVHPIKETPIQLEAPISADISHIVALLDKHRSR